MLISRRNLILGAGATAAYTALHAPAFGQAVSAARTGVARASDFGAATDGVTDASAALARALDSGQIIDGAGGHFAVDGNLFLERKNFRGLANATLIQKTPAGPNRRTLMIRGSSNFVLENVKVIRGGDGSESTERSDIINKAGIFIANCSNFQLRGLDVSGGGIGTGIAIFYCTDFTADDCHVHDMQYLLPRHPDDDSIMGICFAVCQRFTARSLMANDIGGSDHRTHTMDNNRGLAFSSCQDFQVIGSTVRRVGQGMDISGGDPGNGGFTFSQNLAEDCYSFAFKYANTAHDGKILQSIARRCGLGGFVASGPSADGTKMPTQNLLFQDCRVEDILGNFVRVGNGKRPDSSFGFAAEKAHLQPTYPRGVTFQRCTAINTNPGHRMRWGFRNDVPAAAAEGRPNRVIDCHAQGFADSEFLGFG